MKKIYAALIASALVLFCGIFSGCKMQPLLNPLGGINYCISGKVTNEGTKVANVKVTSNYGYTYTDGNGEFKVLAYVIPPFYVDLYDTLSQVAAGADFHVQLSFDDGNGHKAENKDWKLPKPTSISGNSCKFDFAEGVIKNDE